MNFKTSEFLVLHFTVCPELLILFSLKMCEGEKATVKAKCCTGRCIGSTCVLLPFRKPLLCF